MTIKVNKGFPKKYSALLMCKPCPLYRKYNKVERVDRIKGEVMNRKSADTFVDIWELFILEYAIER